MVFKFKKMMNMSKIYDSFELGALPPTHLLNPSGFIILENTVR